jgi:hypothetical protein
MKIRFWNDNKEVPNLDLSAGFDDLHMTCYNLPGHIYQSERVAKVETCRVRPKPYFGINPVGLNSPRDLEPIFLNEIEKSLRKNEYVATLQNSELHVSHPDRFRVKLSCYVWDPKLVKIGSKRAFFGSLPVRFALSRIDICHRIPKKCSVEGAVLGTVGASDPNFERLESVFGKLGYQTRILPSDIIVSDRLPFATEHLSSREIAEAVVDEEEERSYQDSRMDICFF